MKDEDILSVINALRRVDAQLPHYQRSLRKDLLSLHPARRSKTHKIHKYLHTTLFARKYVPLGIGIIILVILLLGLYVIVSPTEESKTKFIASKPESTTTAPQEHRKTFGGSAPKQITSRNTPTPKSSSSPISTPTSEQTNTQLSTEQPQSSSGSSLLDTVVSIATATLNSNDSKDARKEAKAAEKAEKKAQKVLDKNAALTEVGP